MLMLAIVGILASHFWLTYTKKPSPEKKEGFAGMKIPINTEELAHPHPYRPARQTKQAPYSDRPYTPYMDFREGTEDDMIEDDPRDLSWIAAWSNADKFARRGNSCMPIFKTAGPDGTIIETTSKSCESGMPHTRVGERIIIPDSIPEPLKAEIIGHEMIHIYQRRFPDAWNEFYRSRWSFELKKAPPENMPASVVEARRANPDTWREPWSVWIGRFWPVPVYTDPKAPSLREAVTVWWDERDAKLLTAPPDGWTAFFGKPSQDEHPNEISAVLLMTDDYSTEAGRRLMSWWTTSGEILKAKARQKIAPSKGEKDNVRAQYSNF